MGLGMRDEWEMEINMEEGEGKTDTERQRQKEKKRVFLSITLNTKFNTDNWNLSVFKVYKKMKALIFLKSNIHINLMYSIVRNLY